MAHPVEVPMAEQQLVLRESRHHGERPLSWLGVVLPQLGGGDGACAVDSRTPVRVWRGEWKTGRERVSHACVLREEEVRVQGAGADDGVFREGDEGGDSSFRSSSAELEERFDETERQFVLDSVACLLPTKTAHNTESIRQFGVIACESSCVKTKVFMNTSHAPRVIGCCSPEFKHFSSSH